jgi:hypothetical protein
MELPKKRLSATAVAMFRTLDCPRFIRNTHRGTLQHTPPLTLHVNQDLPSQPADSPDIVNHQYLDAILQKGMDFEQFLVKKLEENGPIPTCPILQEPIAPRIVQMAQPKFTSTPFHVVMAEVKKLLLQPPGTVVYLYNVVMDPPKFHHLFEKHKQIPYEFALLMPDFVRLSVDVLEYTHDASDQPDKVLTVSWTIVDAKASAKLKEYYFVQIGLYHLAFHEIFTPLIEQDPEFQTTVNDRVYKRVIPSEFSGVWRPNRHTGSTDPELLPLTLDWVEKHLFHDIPKILNQEEPIPWTLTPECYRCKYQGDCTKEAEVLEAISLLGLSPKVHAQLTDLINTFSNQKHLVKTLRDLEDLVNKPEFAKASPSAHEVLTHRLKKKGDNLLIVEATRQRKALPLEGDCLTLPRYKNDSNARHIHVVLCQDPRSEEIYAWSIAMLNQESMVHDFCSDHHGHDDCILALVRCLYKVLKSAENDKVIFLFFYVHYSHEERLLLDSLIHLNGTNLCDEDRDMLEICLLFFGHLKAEMIGNDVLPLHPLQSEQADKRSIVATPRFPRILVMQHVLNETYAMPGSDTSFLNACKYLLGEIATSCTEQNMYLKFSGHNDMHDYMGFQRYHTLFASLLEKVMQDTQGRRKHFATDFQIPKPLSFKHPEIRVMMYQTYQDKCETIRDLRRSRIAPNARICKLHLVGQETPKEEDSKRKWFKFKLIGASNLELVESNLGKFWLAPEDLKDIELTLEDEFYNNLFTNGPVQKPVFICDVVQVEGDEVVLSVLEKQEFIIQAGNFKLFERYLDFNVGKIEKTMTEVDKEVDGDVSGVLQRLRVPNQVKYHGNLGDLDRSILEAWNRLGIDVITLDENVREGIRRMYTHMNHVYWGPPGTGKTTTLARMTLCAFEMLNVPNGPVNPSTVSDVQPLVDTQQETRAGRRATVESTQTQPVEFRVAFCAVTNGALDAFAQKLVDLKTRSPQFPSPDVFPVFEVKSQTHTSEKHDWSTGLIFYNSKSGLNTPVPTKNPITGEEKTVSTENGVFIGTVWQMFQ